MAAISDTQLVKRMPLGDRVLKTFRGTSNATANTATEWIDTDLSKIEAVVGYSVIGTSAAPVQATGSVIFTGNPANNETVTIGGVVYTFKTTIDPNGVAASGTIVCTSSDPSDGDTITVDGIVYNIETGTIDANAYHVDQSATEATMATNIKKAINDEGTRGTDYSVGIAAHRTVRATVNSATVTLTALTPGTWGNAITLATSNGTAFTVSGATLTGGEDPTDAYTVLIGASATATGENLRDAINRGATAGTDYGFNTAAHPDVSASAASGTVTLTARVPGVVGNSIALAESASNTTVSGANLTGGADNVAGGNFRKNAQGTGVTEGTNMGDLGVEFGAPSVTFEVTVIGRP